ncbi:EF-hand domain-containing protein [Maridesulfovibrio zosterae]|uniref:EF-hand domain-containing protein n=1 Tax=Maridesulfovibrio zosterae TaxID=82171 RepID=UPI000408FCBC|nr:EF-hand domain-containing protein [Maridesulfovibrio zosterae]
MSISALDSSMVGNLFSSDQFSLNRTGQKGSAKDFAKSIIGEEDSDGDGLISLEESSLDKDRFNKVDSDGDGTISQEEIVADFEKIQEQMAMLGRMSVTMQGGNSGSIVDSLINELDTDGDSLISQEESGLEDELFNTLDADGDGKISSEEIEAGMTPPEGMMSSEGMSAQAGSASGSSSSSSSSEEGEEEYDEYDYNQDGVVTSDELERAYTNGDSSLEDIVGRRGDKNQPYQKEDGQSGQSIMQRMAMRAYQDQASAMYSGSSLGALA